MINAVSLRDLKNSVRPRMASATLVRRALRGFASRKCTEFRAAGVPCGGHASEPRALVSRKAHLVARRLKQLAPVYASALCHSEAPLRPPLAEVS